MLATPELIAAAGQRDRLAQALPRYRQEIPLYRSMEGRTGDVPLPGSDGSWQRLPLITKQDIRRGFPDNFLGADQDLDDLVEREVLELEHTSGTSEERTALLLPKGWWAEQERRALDLNATAAALLADEPAARRVTISSPVCSGDICYTGVPSRSERIVDNTLYLSLSRLPFLWGEAELDRMVAETLEWDPRFLDVDPVYGLVFALHCERRGIRFPSLRFILCSYEFLSRVHRRIFQRVFKVPVFNLYGSTETGHLLMEDEHGRMRPSMETAFLEVLEPDSQGIGELIVTTLTNDYMPLIRYRIGDLVQAHEAGCGTHYTLHGRALDAFHTPDGRRVATLEIDRCFEQTTGIAHYQLVQRQPGPWLLRYLPDPQADGSAHLPQLQRQLTALLGFSTPIELKASDVLMPESSGKFRLGYPQNPAVAI